MHERFKITEFVHELPCILRVVRGVRAFVAFGVLAAPVRAEPSLTFELSVVRLDGAGSCPSGPEFERRVAARLGRMPFTDPAERTIETLLSRRESVWHAAITLRGESGIAQGHREIEAAGDDCDPLAEAITLALALAIDPDAALGAPPPGLMQAPEPAAPPSPPAPPAPPSPPAPPCPPPTCPSPPRCPPFACPPPPAVPYIAASARAALALGLVPRAAPGVALAAEAGSQWVRGHVGLLYFPETPADDPRFAFGLTTAAAGACGALRPAARLELALCGDIQLGAIHAVVRDAVPVDPGDELWLAGALGPRLRFDVLLPVVVDVGVSAVVPFLDRSFDVKGMGEPVFEPASVGAVCFAGVGVRTP